MASSASKKPSVEPLFPSLKELIQAHSLLLDTVTEELSSNRDLERVEEFLARAAASGCFIDCAEDRKEVQGIIEYWASTLYASVRWREDSIDSPYLDSTRIVLADFDATEVRSSASALSQTLAAMPRQQRELANHVLSQLTRFDLDLRRFERVDVSLKSLGRTVDQDALDACIDELLETNAINVHGTSTGGRFVRIKSDALLRMPPLKDWLERSLRDRMSATPQHSRLLKRVDAFLDLLLYTVAFTWLADLLSHQRGATTKPDAPSAGQSVVQPIDRPIDFTRALWRYRWAACLPAVAGMLVGFLVYLQTPSSYRSSIRLFVEHNKGLLAHDPGTQERVRGIPSTETLRALLYSDTVLSMAQEDEEIKAFTDRLNSLAGERRLQTVVTLESEYIDPSFPAAVAALHCDTDDPRFSRALVASISNALQELFGASLAPDAIQFPGVSIHELGGPTDAYVTGPKLRSSLGLGCFIGMALGVILVFVLEKNAETFRDPTEISEILGVPVLTHVPFFKGRIRKVKKGEIDPFEKLDPYLSVVHQPASVAAEAVRSCRTSMFFEMASFHGGKVIQITSPLPGDGKSTIAGNLACSIAQAGKRVLLVDCDLRRPQLSDNFGVEEEPGLTNVLNGECELDQAVHQSPLATLSLLPSGPIPSNPAEALTLPEMAELFDILRDQYDYIVVDTPPLLVVTDPSITASMVDGVVMALRVRRKSKPNAIESMNILRAVGAKILGVVTNNSDEASSSDGYRGYGYYRYGRYTSRYYRTSPSTPESTEAPVVVSGRGRMPLRRTLGATESEVSGRN